MSVEKIYRDRASSYWEHHWLAVKLRLLEGEDGRIGW